MNLLFLSPSSKTRVNVPFLYTIAHCNVKVLDVKVLDIYFLGESLEMSWGFFTREGSNWSKHGFYVWNGPPCWVIYGRIVRWFWRIAWDKQWAWPWHDSVFRSSFTGNHDPLTWAQLSCHYGTSYDGAQWSSDSILLVSTWIPRSPSPVSHCQIFTEVICSHSSPPARVTFFY